MNIVKTVLDYLLRSPAKRRLLAALWVEDARGSVSELAHQAHVSFATTYRELHAMLRYSLVTVAYADGVARFAANREHPLASSLYQLVRWRGTVPTTPADDELRARLADLGAPVRSEADPGRAHKEVEELVVRAALLARRDPVTARAMPVLLHARRASLDRDRLLALARGHGAAHTLGFLLAIAAKLGGDRKLADLARELRDHRVSAQPFFLGSSDRTHARFPLAARWGFRMRTDEAAFRSTFERFAEATP